MEDVEEAVSLGPFFTSSEVSSVVGDPWIPTQRFEVVQKNKVRGVDSATVNGINTASSVSEKLDLPSTDVNVSALRWLRSNVIDQPISGWVLDERKAYRQIAIRPDHRRWSVIALRQPCSGRDCILRHDRPFLWAGILGLQLQQEIGGDHGHPEEDLWGGCFQLL